MSAAGVGGHTDCGGDESTVAKGKREEAKQNRAFFLSLSADFGARYVVVESWLSIFNAIMSCRV